MREADQVLAAFQLGLGRQALPSRSACDGPLAALAMTAQALRFAQPPPPPPEDGPGWALPDDPRPLLPDGARAALLRLAARLDAASAQVVAGPLLLQLRATGHRLHPFDLPHLSGMLAAAGDALGRVERAWMDRDGGGTDGDDLDEQNWRRAADMQRLLFLDRLRRTHPAAARTLLGAGFATETTKMRTALLGVLRVRLGPDDVPFLTGCCSDRAASVRERAEALLAKLPSAADHAARVEAASRALCIEASGTRRRLVYRAPSWQGQPVAPSVLLEQVGLGGLAQALEATPDALVEMAEDGALCHALANCALLDGREDMALRLLGVISAPSWPADVIALIGFDRLPPDRRRAFAAAAFRPDVCVLGGDWHGFGRLLDGPLDPDTTMRLVRCKPWRDLLEGLPEGKADGVLLPVASLIPRKLAAAVAATLDALPVARRPRTSLLLACLTELAALEADTLTHPKDHP